MNFKYRTYIFFIIGIAIIIPLLYSGCSTTYIDKRATSPQFKDGIFRNPVMIEKTWWDFFKVRVTHDWAKWPDWVDSDYGTKPLARVLDDEIRATVINHATVLIQTQGFNILTDPIYSKRASPFSFAGPKRVRNAGIRFDDLPAIDVVIISHDHYDHLDLATIKKLVKRDKPKVFLGLGVGEYLDSMENVTELDWWQAVEIAKNFKLTFVPVQHFSGRGLFDRFSTLWGGYVLELSDRKIYFGGDSGYADHYTKTYLKFGAMDLSFLPIGAYEPKVIMEYAHMDPYQAVQAHLDLHSRRSVGIHYETFQLTAEEIDEPVRLLKEAKAEAGIDEQDFIATEFGQALIL